MAVVSSKAVYSAYQIEATNGTPVLPNKFSPNVENSLDKNIENINSESRFGVLNNVFYTARGSNKISGSVNTELDTTHSLLWFYLLFGQITSADISSLTDGSVYKHTIKDYVCAYKSATVENKKGGCTALGLGNNNIIVQRSYGIVPDSTKLNIESNKIISLENEVKGAGMFDVSFLVANESPEATTKAITSATPTGAVTSTRLRLVTATHGLAKNDLVKIAGNSVTAYNGYWKVINIVDSTTFDVDCTVAGSAGTGGTVNKISMFYFQPNTITGILASDSVVLRESTTNTYEQVTVRYVDTVNSVLGFDTVTSTAFTIANKTNVQLIAQVESTTGVDLYAFSNATLQMGTTVALAQSATPTDFEKLNVSFNKNTTDIIQNLKNIAVPTGLETTIEIDRAYEGNEQREIHRSATEMAFVITIDLKKVVSATDTNNATYKIVITIPRVVYKSIDITDANGEVIKEKIVGLAEHDFSLGYSSQIEITNSKIGTYYTA